MAERCACPGDYADAAAASAFCYILNGGASTISKAVHELNEDIRDKEIRVIGAEGDQLGIMSSADALRLAGWAIMEARESEGWFSYLCK